EIAGHSADQKPRIEPGMLEDPGENARRSRLAMRAGNCKNPSACEHMTREPFGPGRIGNPAFKQRLHERIAAAHHITDDDDIRSQRELPWIVAFDELDSHRGALSGHRPI